MNGHLTKHSLPLASFPRLAHLRPLVLRQHSGLGTRTRAGRLACCAATSDQVQLLQPVVEGFERTARPQKVLVYFPGTDGTGNAIAPQLPSLFRAGFDVRTLYIDILDRSSWQELTSQALELLRGLLASHPTEQKVTLLAESFGGCLALRCASVAPDIIERLVLVNPATCFASSYGGILNLVAGSNLLSLFPQQLYEVAQTVLLPFLVDQENVGEIGMDAVRQMIVMRVPENRRLAELVSSRGHRVDNRRSILEQFESYAPAGAVSWRLQLLCTGNLPDVQLRRIRIPTLLISSAKDRLLGSLQEGARLERLLQNALRVVLPKSGHTALLEADVDLVELMRSASFLAPELSAEPPFRGGSGRSRQDSLSNRRRGYAGWDRPTRSSAFRALTSQDEKAALPRRHALATRSCWPSAPPSRGRGCMAAKALRKEPSKDPHELTAEPTEALDALEKSSAKAPEPPRSKKRRPSTRPAKKGSELADQAPPPWSMADPAFEQLTALYDPFREIVSPVVSGLDNLPNSHVRRPLLLVGNHARVGLYDLPFLVIELYKRNIKVRGLAHPGHWKGPLGSIFQSFGAVKASPMAAYKLLKAKEAVLLFPGGGREVNKRKGEDYQLFWSVEPDFVRLAAKMNALIIPFASVGGDEAFNIALDSEEVLQTPILGDLMRAAITRVGPELDLDESVPPVTSLPGVGLPSPLPVPNFARLYFRFLPPVDPAAAEGILTDPEVAQRVYNIVKQSVCDGISILKEEQQSDPRNSLPTRLLDQMLRAMPPFNVLL